MLNAKQYSSESAKYPVDRVGFSSSREMLDFPRVENRGVRAAQHNTRYYYSNIKFDKINNRGAFCSRCRLFILSTRELTSAPHNNYFGYRYLRLTKNRR